MRLTTVTRSAAVLLAALAAGGCEPKYDTGRHPAADLSPRKTWKAAGDLSDPQQAIDDDQDTAAVSGSVYTNSVITIDLGRTCMFNAIVVHHGNDQHGYCRRVSILTSVDGKKFTARAALPGNRRVSYFSLVTPVVARYVRLQAVVPGNRPWSVAEIYFQ